MRNFFSQNNHGFTLVETLVAVSIFTIIFTIAIGGFVSAMRTQRQLQALISANSNASLAIEQMAREIRTGAGFKTVPEPCNDSCRLEFLNVKKQPVAYWVDASNNLMRSENWPVDSGNAITAENVSVRYLRFEVLGSCSHSDPPDHDPRVTVVLGVSPRSEQGVKEDVTEIQTTVASRQGLVCEDAILQVD